MLLALVASPFLFYRKVVEIRVSLNYLRLMQAAYVCLQYTSDIERDKSWLDMNTCDIDMFILTFDIIYDVQSFSGVTTAISCNENFPIRSECDLETSTVIKVQVAKKIYYFFINIVMFFIPILLMTICYSMIVAKLYCSSSPGERLGGGTPQVLCYFYFILRLISSIIETHVIVHRNSSVRIYHTRSIYLTGFHLKLIACTF